VRDLLGFQIFQGANRERWHGRNLPFREDLRWSRQASL
jgi:hypothetical protein